MNMRIMLSSVLLITLAFFALSPVEALAQTISSSVFDFKKKIITLTNADRYVAGETGVKLNTALSVAAQQKADDMIARQYFSHISPTGVTPWHWFTEGGYTYLYAGENLAMDFYEPTSVEAAWMASPLHRANILNAKYKDIGLGLAQGLYQGKPVVFIVEFFGTQPTATAKIKTTSPTLAIK